MMMKKMCGVHKVAWMLVLVGALNWGLVGAFNLNVVMKLFGSMPMLERAIYALVGLSAVMMLGMHKCCMKGGKCPGCGKEGCMCWDEKPSAPKPEQKMQ